MFDESFQSVEMGVREQPNRFLGFSHSLFMICELWERFADFKTNLRSQGNTGNILAFLRRTVECIMELQGL